MSRLSFKAAAHAWFSGAPRRLGKARLLVREWSLERAAALFVTEAGLSAARSAALRFARNARLSDAAASELLSLLS